MKVEKHISAHELHAKAEDARESDDHIGALKLLDEAIILYQKDSNYTGVCEALQSRVLTLKHLYFLTKDSVFAHIAQKEAESSLDIALEHNLKTKLSSCYFRLGEIAMIFDNYPKAIVWYRKSLSIYQGTLAEKGDYTYHLGEALYRNGQKAEALQLFNEGLKDIQEGAKQIDPFLTHVWESGLHMKLADLLKDDDAKEARAHLKMATEIATNDPKLVIRRRQIEEISQRITPK